MRVLLLVLCVVQLVIAFAILYATAVTGYLHDPFHEVFTEGVASLCAFAACAGFVGVCASSRPMLLFLYINQLWSLSNVSTFAVIYLTTDEQSATACHLFATGELSRQQVRLPTSRTRARARTHDDASRSIHPGGHACPSLARRSLKIAVSTARPPPLRAGCSARVCSFSSLSCGRCASFVRSTRRC